MMKLALVISALIGLVPALEAEEYQIFDGRYYNNLYYPNIDIIEWGEPTHLEFQIYDKKRAISVTGRTIEKNGRKLFLAAFDFSFRKERLCRRVIAPASFKVGQTLYFYRDDSDAEMNNFIISAHPLPDKTPHPADPLEKCIEQTAQIDRTDSEAQVAAQTQKKEEEIIVIDLRDKSTERQPASEKKTDRDQSSDSNETKKDHNDDRYHYSINDESLGRVASPKDYDWFSNKN